MYEDKRLEREEDEAFARLQRLRKQRKILKEKGVKMVREGLENMDTLEAREEEERRASLVDDPVVALDWSSLGLELPVGLDFGGGTPGAPAGSSAGA